MDLNDLDDVVLGVVESAAFAGSPLRYAVGPLSDRRVRQEFRHRNIVAPMDQLCGSINRLESMGVLEKIPTGEFMVGAGSCGSKDYPIVELQPR